MVVLAGSSESPVVPSNLDLEAAVGDLGCSWHALLTRLGEGGGVVAEEASVVPAILLEESMAAGVDGAGASSCGGEVSPVAGFAGSVSSARSTAWSAGADSVGE